MESPLDTPGLLTPDEIVTVVPVVETTVFTDAIAVGCVKSFTPARTLIEAGTEENVSVAPLDVAALAVSVIVPFGESVEQTVVRFGIPPLDIMPGFQAKFLSGGMICPGGGGITFPFDRGKIISVLWDGDKASATVMMDTPKKKIRNALVNSTAPL